jgi:2-amino-4-hydroxy-6-hydroxymethyldihydropteridine diphosphokinase
MIRCFIGLGSNLNEPQRQVQQACEALATLPGSDLDSISPWYRSKAVGPGQQPDYINGVAQLTTRLTPFKLLHALQLIENQQQRVREQHWGPRTLDLDLLMYGEQVINTPELTVPHPRIQKRNFVLYPLADIAPQLLFPDGTSLLSLLDYCSRDGLILADTIITESPLDQSGQL